MALCTMQSGASAISAAASPVAATPEWAAEAGQLAGVLPTLAGFDTQRPTNSRSGRASMPARTWRPTLPVLQATTL